jgi:hypothetical protein
VLSQHLPAGATDALKALARKHGATPFMAFLAVYAALLARLSGDEDIPIGTPVAGRARAELARLVGFFANTLVIRADLAGAPSFADALERTRDTVLDALERQDVPFERLVEALGVARDPSRNPLFQVAFTMRESDARELAFDGMTVRRDSGRHGRAKFDLTLSLVDAADGVSAHWEYCADLFDASTIERMALQYAKLIAAFAAAPAAPIHAPSLLDEATRRRVVVDANRTATAFPSTTTVHARVTQQASAHPRAIAIGGIDYATLDARANRLAHALVAAGVGPRAFVGVARAKPADIAIAWLAVLKAGAAYVPIDLEAACRAHRLRARRRAHRRGGRRRRRREPFRGASRERRVPGRRRGEARDASRHAAWRRHRTGGCGVRDLHVGLDRIAQGRGRAAPRGAPAGVRHRLRAARPGRRRRAAREPGVRRVDVRVLGCVLQRRAPRADREDDRAAAARAGRGARRREGQRDVHHGIAVQRDGARGAARVRVRRDRAGRRRGRSSRAGSARCSARAHPGASSTATARPRRRRSPAAT